MDIRVMSGVLDGKQIRQHHWIQQGNARWNSQGDIPGQGNREGQDSRYERAAWYKTASWESKRRHKTAEQVYNSKYQTAGGIRQEVV